VSCVQDLQENHFSTRTCKGTSSDITPLNSSDWQHQPGALLPRTSHPNLISGADGTFDTYDQTRNHESEGTSRVQTQALSQVHSLASGFSAPLFSNWPLQQVPRVLVALAGAAVSNARSRHGGPFMLARVSLFAVLAMNPTKAQIVPPLSCGFVGLGGCGRGGGRRGPTGEARAVRHRCTTSPPPATVCDTNYN
jgi:hypothetical protein